MKKQLFLALLFAASVVSEAATIPVQAPNAQVIPKGEGLPIPHQVDHPHRLERRGGLKAALAADTEAQQQPPQVQQAPPQKEQAPQMKRYGQHDSHGQSGQFAPFGQQPAPFGYPGQQYGPYEQQSGAYWQQPGAYGQQPGAYGQQPGAYGQQSGAYGQQSGASGQHFDPYQPYPSALYAPPSASPSAPFAASPSAPFAASPSAPFAAPPSAPPSAPSQYGHSDGRLPQQYGKVQHGGNPYLPSIEQNLKRIIQQNRLNAFYDGPRLQSVLNRLANIDFTTIGESWKIKTLELTLQLAPLALYDIVFFCDDSGSMYAGSRSEDLEEILGRVAELAMQFDDDGIQIRFMNSDKKADGIKSMNDVKAFMETHSPNGETPLGSSFNQKVLQPLILQKASNRQLEKPVLAIIITDGQPSEGEGKIFSYRVTDAIRQLVLTPYGPGAIAIEIAQVGTDKLAQAYLASLDKDPTPVDQHTKLKDYIDATSSFELEQGEYMAKGKTLSPGAWLVKLCVGALDRAVDGQDE